jgi:hypothetical protein
MDKSYLIHFTNPAAGREDEYNDWYTNRHIHDIVGLDSFAAAQRFRFAPANVAAESPYRYLAIYEATGDIAKAEADLAAAGAERKEALAAGREPAIPISPALGEGSMTLWFTAITERLAG